MALFTTTIKQIRMEEFISKYAYLVQGIGAVMFIIGMAYIVYGISENQEKILENQK
jgi:hypothetical protein